VNLKSKRFMFAAMVGAVWFAAAVRAIITGDLEVLNSLNPWCLGYLTSYSGWESWRPAGLNGGTT